MKGCITERNKAAENLEEKLVILLASTQQRHKSRLEYAASAK